MVGEGHYRVMGQAGQESRKPRRALQDGVARADGLVSSKRTSCSWVQLPLG